MDTGAELFAIEREYPLFQVILTGDEVPWVHRESPEYYDEDGKEQLVVKPARAVVDCRAVDEDAAVALALKHNPDYHTVESVTQYT